MLTYTHVHMYGFVCVNAEGTGCSVLVSTYSFETGSLSLNLQLGFSPTAWVLSARLETSKPQPCCLLPRPLRSGIIGGLPMVVVPLEATESMDPIN